jgi:hypothetical protein
MDDGDGDGAISFFWINGHTAIRPTISIKWPHAPQLLFFPLFKKTKKKWEANTKLLSAIE